MSFELTMKDDWVDDEEMIISRRMINVCLVKCLCWICIGIFQWMISYGYNVSDFTKHIFGVFLFPCTSSLDPMLYLLNVFTQQRQSRMRSALRTRLRFQARNKRVMQAKVTTAISRQDAILFIQRWSKKFTISENDFEL